MAEHYILCVLSTIGIASWQDEDTGETVTSKPPHSMRTVAAATKSYEHNDNGEALAFDGFQTNEAPVKCLIDLGLIEKRPVTRIICLTSPACERKGSIIDENGEPLSARDWFERSIVDFYRNIEEFDDENNPALKDGFFCHLPYDGVNPSQNLQRLIEVLDKEPAYIDIDTTGGPRDAAFLITNVVQFIEAKYGSAQAHVGSGGQRIGLGRTVYANFRELKLHLQNETFAISSLIHAIESFTQYGKADLLVDYFERPTTGKGTSQEMKSLCNAMRAFSDDLSLCRTVSINKRVNDIRSKLDSFMTATERKIRAYDSNPSDASKVRRGEILFLTLADTLRQDIPTYVPDTAQECDKADQTIAIIRWCIKRGMLMQALALYKERIPECLEQKGLIGWGSNVPTNNNTDTRNGKIVDRVSQLAKFKNPGVQSGGGKYPNVLNRHNVESLTEKLSEQLIDKGERDPRQAKRVIKQVLCAAFPQAAADGKHIEVKDEKRLPGALVWYATINSIRNEMMHVLERGDPTLGRYLFYCRKVFRNAPSRYDGTPASLSSALENALDALDGKAKATPQCKAFVMRAYGQWTSTQGMKP